MSISIITKREVILSVRNRWRAQYQKRIADAAEGDWVCAVDDRLFKLDLNSCSSEDVDAAIGVKNWATNGCGECGRDVDIIVQIGDEPDYDARWINICADCLDNAKAAILAVPKEKQ